MLLGLSSDSWLGEVAVELSGDKAFEATHGFSLGEAFGRAVGDVGLGGGGPSRRLRRAGHRSCPAHPDWPAHWTATPLPAFVQRLAERAGITKHISPHSLRHSFITAAFDAGVPLRDVQIAARHADPRSTTRYDWARNNLDRHASYVATAFIAGAT